MGQHLTWSQIRDEFLGYYDPQRRSESRMARHALLAGECTLVKYGSVKRYEQEYRRLVRECRDLSVTDQIIWFVHGFTPEYKKQIATKPDGTEWEDLNSLVNFALGIETRLEIANQSIAEAPFAKKSKLAALTTYPGTPRPTAQGRGAWNAPKGGVSKASNGGGQSSQGAIPDWVPHRAINLYKFARRTGARAPNGKLYADTPEEFLDVCGDKNRPQKCLFCKGPWPCPQHSGGGGGGAGGSGAGKGKGKQQRR